LATALISVFTFFFVCHLLIYPDDGSSYFL
jgi:hypothetical protein